MMDFAAMLLSFTALFMLKISSLPEFYFLLYTIYLCSKKCVLDESLIFDYVRDPYDT